MVEVQAENRAPLAVHLELLEAVDELANALNRETRGFWARRADLEVPPDFYYFRRWMLSGRRDYTQVWEGNEKARAQSPELFGLYDFWNQQAERLGEAIDQAESHLLEQNIDFGDEERAVGDRERTHQLELLMRFRHCFPPYIEPGPPELEQLNDFFPDIRNELDLAVARTRGQIAAGVTGVFAQRAEDAVSIAARSIPEVVVGLEEVEALWKQGDRKLSDIMSWMGSATGGFEKLGRSMRWMLDRHLNWVNRRIDQVLPALESSLADQVLALTTKLDLDAYFKDRYREEGVRWRQQWSVTGIEPELTRVCRRLRAVVPPRQGLQGTGQPADDSSRARSTNLVGSAESYRTMDMDTLTAILREQAKKIPKAKRRKAVSKVLEALLRVESELMTTSEIAEAGLKESTLRSACAKFTELHPEPQKQGRSNVYLRRMIMWYVVTHWDARDEG